MNPDEDDFDLSPLGVITHALKLIRPDDASVFAHRVLHYLGNYGFEVTQKAAPPQWFYRCSVDGVIKDPDEPYGSPQEAVEDEDPYTLFCTYHAHTGYQWGFAYSVADDDREYIGTEVNWYDDRAEAERMLAEYQQPDLIDEVSPAVFPAEPQDTVVVGRLVDREWVPAKRVTIAPDPAPQEQAPAPQPTPGVYESTPRKPGQMARYSYHDVHLTLSDGKRQRLGDMPFNIELSCTRVGGWQVWVMNTDPGARSGNRLGSEYDPVDWLVVDIDGVPICQRCMPEADGAQAPPT